MNASMGGEVRACGSSAPFVQLGEGLRALGHLADAGEALVVAKDGRDVPHELLLGHAFEALEDVGVLGRVLGAVAEEVLVITQ